MRDLLIRDAGSMYVTAAIITVTSARMIAGVHSTPPLPAMKYHANPLIPREDGRLPLDNALHPGRPVNPVQQAEMVRLLSAVSGQ